MFSEALPPRRWKKAILCSRRLCRLDVKIKSRASDGKKHLWKRDEKMPLKILCIAFWADVFFFGGGAHPKQGEQTFASGERWMNKGGARRRQARKKTSNEKKRWKKRAMKKARKNVQWKWKKRAINKLSRASKGKKASNEKKRFYVLGCSASFWGFFVEGPVLGGTLPRQGREIKTGEVLAGFGGGSPLAGRAMKKARKKSDT